MRLFKSRRSVRLALAAVAGFAFSIGGAGAAFAGGSSTSHQGVTPAGKPGVTATVGFEHRYKVLEEFPWW